MAQIFPPLRSMEVDEISDCASYFPNCDSAASTAALETDMHSRPIFVNAALSSNFLRAHFGTVFAFLKTLSKRTPSVAVLFVQITVIWQIHLFEILLSALALDSVAIVYHRGKALAESYKRYGQEGGRLCGCRGFYRLDQYANILLPFVLLLRGVFPGSPRYHEFRIWLRRHPADQHLSSKDQIWLNDSHNNNCCIVGMAVTAGQVTLREVQHAFLTRWIHVEYKLRSILTVQNGRSTWSICNFADALEGPAQPSVCAVSSKPTIALSDLIKEVTLSITSSHRSETTPAEAAVHEFLSSLASVPMRSHMPLWEIYLINNVDEHSYVAIKCHHAIMDGTACACALANVLFDPGHTPLYTVSTKHGGAPAMLFYLFQALRTIVIGIVPLLRWLTWYPSSPALLQTPQPPMQREIVLPRRVELTGKKCFAPCSSIPLDQVKNSARTLTKLSGIHFSIHDVLTICSVQAADDLRRGRAHDIAAKIRRGERWRILQSSFSETFSDLKTNESYESRPDDYLYTLLPMSCRMSVPSQMDNCTAPILVSHPFHRMGNMGESVWSWDHMLAIRNMNAQIKHNKTQFVFFIFIRIFCKILPRALTRMLVQRALVSPIASVSNLAGPAQRARLCGKLVNSIHFWAPAGGQVSVGLAFLSYGGDLQITAAFDSSELAGLFTSDNGECPALKADILSSILGGLIVEKLHQLSNSIGQHLTAQEGADEPLTTFNECPSGVAHFHKSS